jgi:hypothetical protein
LAVQSEGDQKELLIKQLPDRKLDLAEVYVLDYEKDTHAAPNKDGVIVPGAKEYQVIPVETFVSGEVFEGVEEKYLVCHPCHVHWVLVLSTTVFAQQTAVRATTPFAFAGC